MTRATANLSTAVESGSAHADFIATVVRLNIASAQKNYQAHRDIDWDAPEARIDRRDPRLCLGPENPLGASAWYASLPQERRAELGLEYVCQNAKIGASFESVLSRGLLEFARTQPNRSPSYRYALHEVVEETNHSLMFQQLIDQSGCDPESVNALESFLDRRVVRWGATFPELFFFFVLAGEIFIDHENRARLRRRDNLHPLIARILQIHVTEEARHVCFAQSYLQEHLPRLSPARRQLLRVVVPWILRGSESALSMPRRKLIREFQIPRSVLQSSFGPRSAHRAQMRQVAEPVYALLERHPAALSGGAAAR